MKEYKISKLIILLFLVFTVTAQAAQVKDAIAIMDFQPKGFDDSGSASIVSDLFRDFLVAYNKFIVVDRASMESILQEQNLQQQLGCSSEECAVNLGKILGVNNIVIGTLGKLGNIYIISIRVVNIENAKIEWSRSAKVSDFSKIDSLVNALVNDMVGTILNKEAQKPVVKGSAQPAQTQQHSGSQKSTDPNNTGQNVVVLEQQQPQTQNDNRLQYNNSAGRYYLYTKRKKSGGTALLLSFFIPSTGHFYAGEPGKALGYLLIEGLELGAFIIGASMDDKATEVYDYYSDTYYYEYETNPVASALMIGGSTLLLLTRIMEVIDAPSAAGRYNTRLLRQMKLGMQFQYDNKSDAMKLSYAFEF